MARTRATILVAAVTGLAMMAIPAVGQLRVEPITPHQKEQHRSHNYTIAHERISGEDRYATALAVSKRLYADKAAREIFLASGEDFPDAIAALNAGKPGVPIPTLLTPSFLLPEPVIFELRRIAAPDAVITLIGGEKAIAPAVQEQLRVLGFTTTRIAGSNRTETAIKLAERGQARSTQIAVVSPADDFAVSIVAAAYANRIGAAHLLTFEDANSQHAIAQWLYSKNIERIHTVGEGVGVLIGLPATALTGTGEQAVFVDMAECYPEDKQCVKPAWLAPEPRVEQQISEFIWKREFGSTSNYVIINGERAVDGIAALQLAAALQSPILTTFTKQPISFGYKEISLDFRYANLMVKEGARDRNFFFVGGEAALSKEVEDLFTGGL